MENIEKELLGQAITEEERAEFQKYLQESGAIRALTNALCKLFQLKYSRPKAAIIFIQQCLSDQNPSLIDYDTLVSNLKQTKAKLAEIQQKQGIIHGSTNLGRNKDGEDEMYCEGDSQSAINNGIGTKNKPKKSRDSVMSVRNSHLTMNGENSFGSTSDLPKDALQMLINLQNNPQNHSLLKKYLTTEMFEKLKDRKTSLGTTLVDCIKSGLQNHNSNIGIYVADPEAFDVFSELMNPVIEDYHSGFSFDKIHPQPDWGDISYFKCLDPDNEYITSSRIRLSRSVANYPLTPLMTEQNFLDLMEQVKEALLSLEGDLSGTFYSLEEMDSKTKKEMMDDGYILEKVDKFLLDAGATKFWPKGRAIFMNEARTFFVWINEEDHLRFISIDVGSDFCALYTQIIKAVDQCAKKLEFARHPRLGWLALCPSTLGSAVRASVMIALPKLTNAGDKLRTLVKDLHLEIRATRQEEYGLHEISNKRKLGLTEFEVVKEMYDGVLKIIEVEKSM